MSDFVKLLRLNVQSVHAYTNVKKKTLNLQHTFIMLLHFIIGKSVLLFIFSNKTTAMCCTDVLVKGALAFTWQKIYDHLNHLNFNLTVIKVIPTGPCKGQVITSGYYFEMIMM